MEKSQNSGFFQRLNDSEGSQFSEGNNMASSSPDDKMPTEVASPSGFGEEATENNSNKREVGDQPLVAEGVSSSTEIDWAEVDDLIWPEYSENYQYQSSVENSETNENANIAEGSGPGAFIMSTPGTSMKRRKQTLLLKYPVLQKEVEVIQLDSSEEEDGSPYGPKVPRLEAEKTLQCIEGEVQVITPSENSQVGSSAMRKGTNLDKPHADNGNLNFAGNYGRDENKKDCVEEQDNVHSLQKMNVDEEQQREELEKSPGQLDVNDLINSAPEENWEGDFEEKYWEQMKDTENEDKKESVEENWEDDDEPGDAEHAGKAVQHEDNWEEENWEEENWEDSAEAAEQENGMKKFEGPNSDDNKGVNNGVGNKVLNDTSAGQAEEPVNSSVEDQNRKQDNDEPNEEDWDQVYMNRAFGCFRQQPANADSVNASLSMGATVGQGAAKANDEDERKDYSPISIPEDFEHDGSPKEQN